MLTSAIIAQVALAAAASVPYPSSLAKGFEAPPIFHSQGGHGICVGGKVPITVSAEGRKSTIPSKISQAFVTDFNQEQLLNSARLRTTFDGGPQTIAGTFKIPATLCIPNTLPEGAKLQTLQILNHGLGSDQSYWDIAPGYSYVDARAAAGYATLNFVCRARSHITCLLSSRATRIVSASALPSNLIPSTWSNFLSRLRFCADWQSLSATRS